MNCGTLAGYQRHRYHKQPACADCKAANARQSARSRGGYRQGPRGRYRMGVSDCIIDVLSTHSRWMTSNTIVEHVLDLHPDWSEASIRSRIVRLYQSGRIERRPNPDCRLNTSFLYFSDEWAPA